MSLIRASFVVAVLGFGANSFAEDFDMETSDYASKYNVEVNHDINDPFEPINRFTFGFNKVVDTIILEPVAQVYKFIVPDWGRQRVRNVLDNLSTPVFMFNQMLQGQPGQGMNSLGRFVVNSTVGVVGIFDPAEDMGLKKVKEDFGQTLGVWGMSGGPYVVIPIIGSSTGRDSVGKVADFFMDPFNYLPNEYVYTRYGVALIQTRAENIELVDEIERISIDEYATVRSLYLQNRMNQIKNTDR